MPKSDSNPEDNDEFANEFLPDDAFSNKRMAVRYRRTDIKAALKIQSLFYPRLLQVGLHDISSRGAAVVSEQKLNKKSRICLYLMFADGKRFDIQSKVVYCDITKNRYGLKFERSNDGLGEHLLSTQKELHFS